MHLLLFPLVLDLIINLNLSFNPDFNDNNDDDNPHDLSLPLTTISLTIYPIHTLSLHLLVTHHHSPIPISLACPRSPPSPATTSPLLMLWPRSLPSRVPVSKWSLRAQDIGGGEAV